MNLLCYSCGTLQSVEQIITPPNKKIVKALKELLTDCPEKYIEKVPGKCICCKNKTLMPEDILQT